LGTFLPERRMSVSRHFELADDLKTPVRCHESLGTDSDQKYPSESPTMWRGVPRTAESIVNRLTSLIVSIRLQLYIVA